MAHGKISPLFVAALGFGALAQALFGDVVPGRYMVEFEEGQDQTTFTTHLKFNRLSADLKIATESEVFKGASYQFDPSSVGDPVAALKSLPSVKRVWPVRTLHRPKVQSAWNGTNLDAIPADIKKFITLKDGAFSPHVSTQVDRLHAEGITGKGVKIGIVDSGIDYKHPALGGGFGPGFTVTRGYDLLGDEYWPSRDPAPLPDPDPYADCDGHGTHVAGIIAAQKNELGFIGAAPGAEIGMYRVFSCHGGTTEDIVIAGINKAFSDGNDIITASLGGYSGWPEDPLSVVTERINAKGVVTTFAQGNSGEMGPFFTETPANGKDSVAIGSTANTELTRIFSNATYSVDNKTTEPFGWTYGQPAKWTNESLPLYVGEWDTHSSCSEFEKAGNLTGHIVLVRELSSCATWYKATFAAAKGARHVLFWSNDSEATSSVFYSDPPPSADEFKHPIAVGTISRAQAMKFIELAKSGKHVTVKITDPDYSTHYLDTIPYVEGGYMNEWSSWGPTFELDAKPDFSAPGGYILSTWPRAQGGYSVISGTSMATPLAAAIIALIIEARGKLSPSELRSLISTTAKPINLLNGTTPLSDLAPIPQQGAGVIQAWDAVHTTGIVNTNKIILNDTTHFVGDHKVTIKNTGAKEATYIISNKGAPTFYALDGTSSHPPPRGPITRRYANVSFSQSSITVAPGQEATVSLSFTPPKDVDAKLLPVYSGYISLDGTNGGELTIPYLGVAASMSEATNIENILIGENTDVEYPRKRVSQGHRFLLPGPDSDPSLLFVQPVFQADLPLGVALFNMTIYSVKNSGNATIHPAPLDQDLGPYPGFPWIWLPRYNRWSHVWNGTLSNGTTVPAGAYTFVFNALKILGDRSKKEGYTTIRTVDIVIDYHKP